MTTRFNECPNCGNKPGGMFGGTHFTVYRCKDCGRYYCYDCGGDRCPKCDSDDRREAGEVWVE